MVLGAMEMPEQFRYADVMRKGFPRHERTDAFSMRHPPMSSGQWAKIFAPFDALRGFREAVSSKETVLTQRVELCDRELEKLDHCLRKLAALTQNTRQAAKNRVMVSVTYFVPRFDVDGTGMEQKGRYETVTGMVWKIDACRERAIYVGHTVIALEDILSIESSDPRLADTGLEYGGL